MNKLTIHHQDQSLIIGKNESDDDVIEITDCFGTAFFKLSAEDKDKIIEQLTPGGGQWITLD